MYKRFIILLCFVFSILISCDEKKLSKNNEIAYNDFSCDIDPSKLTAKEYDVLINKGTEFPFTGELLNIKDDGLYTCKLCGNPLFKSDAKFNSGTGWPSFDDAIVENIKFVKDGSRVEVLCARCGGHLGHVFYNEGFTDKQTRYCINSVSLNFINKIELDKTNSNTNK
ncbi:peptide-methionine (R)-S-oxide reductase MsrB [Brachyspira pilosicoli]|uniref:peptide-methionine (R)-S-oxide reductase MsrB n=1 Tax=Brachyspira pilosicoli TaxID=52584 RepID=UPI001CA4D162|nr:peptide-methionine (R)-S-oxide reductase MsrB [Brachyspira pilosicoli]MBW5382635.1 peptide-methionine (R)-S-oxide reductase MsrB [Brachyspira pilosicoli]